jgi:hypothetical protein
VKKQREATQATYRGSFRAYTNLPYAPVSSTRNDGASAEDGGPDLPIVGYARLSVGEISDDLGEPSAGEVEKLKECDIKNKNHHCLAERSDRSLA